MEPTRIRYTIIEYGGIILQSSEKQTLVFCIDKKRTHRRQSIALFYPGMQGFTPKQTVFCTTRKPLFYMVLETSISVEVLLTRQQAHSRVTCYAGNCFWHRLLRGEQGYVAPPTAQETKQLFATLRTGFDCCIWIQRCTQPKMPDRWIQTPNSYQVHLLLKVGGIECIE